jgi:hypothetical protein
MSSFELPWDGNGNGNYSLLTYVSFVYWLMVYLKTSSTSETITASNGRLTGK